VLFSGSGERQGVSPPSAIRTRCAILFLCRSVTVRSGVDGRAFLGGLTPCRSPVHGNDTAHTVSQHNRVTNDGTYSYEYNNEGSRTKRTKLSDGSK